MVPDHALVEAPDAQEAVAMVARGDFAEYHRWEPGESKEIGALERELPSSEWIVEALEETPSERCAGFAKVMTVSQERFESVSKALEPLGMKVFAFGTEEYREFCRKESEKAQARTKQYWKHRVSELEQELVQAKKMMTGV